MMLQERIKKMARPGWGWTPEWIGEKVERVMRGRAWIDHSDEGISAPGAAAREIAELVQAETGRPVEVFYRREGVELVLDK